MFFVGKLTAFLTGTMHSLYQRYHPSVRTIDDIKKKEKKKKKAASQQLLLLLLLLLSLL